ncbi:hypothetical protein [Pseudomonas aeruginosa]|uniref:hypothetical protein n=6 Tax=Pseudomonas aeruginosa TaxID=287 RepID=UPI000F83FB69|nr:hypothetical protein [Pseudomonas aeruginosa]EKT7991617.1 hypothetical protein [Pseudomonas aeruginosa]EKX5232119.1 hypothetical protein [Pseudomonas aeruginosa]ELJ3065550.1 hypothetical protein [Pseudomonas aeruginosa]MBG3895643.1 hypothetical protein [Pseudomonas aeruginosa]MDO5907587.1 hypothetical protein [Pseudomonas aeruginosa]
MSLAEYFNNAGVKCAHIIDDAFDQTPTVAFSRDEAQALIDKLDDDRFGLLCEIIGMPEADEQSVIDALQNIEAVAAFFNARESFGDISAVFDGFFQDRAGKKGDLELLIKFLRANGVECFAFGADYSLSGHAEPQLVFIDLRLKENGGQISIADAVNVCGKVYSNYPECKPFVFLMSTLSAPLSNLRESFYLSAKLFASQFESIEKSIFRDSSELESILARYTKCFVELGRLHDRVGSVGNAIIKAADNVKATLRSLDLPDYFVLHHNTASIERVGLGTYVVDLLLEYLVREVESSPEIWGFASELDGWEIKNLPRSRFGLTYSAGKIYSGNMLHSKYRLDCEEQRGLGPSDGYFYLGDIFFLRAELGSGRPRKALVISTPACDLVRPDKLRERTIFLCEGRVSDVTLSTIPSGQGGIPTTIIEWASKPGKQLSIEWGKKKLHTWHAEDMDSFKEQGCQWVRVGRLRPIYAIQLQHAITADLSRIGVQRPPNMLKPCGIRVFISTGSRWEMLDDEELKVPSASAIADSEDGKQGLYIVSDTTVRRIRRKLLQWVVKKGTLPSAAIVKNIAESLEFEERLMYCKHMREDGQAAAEDTVFPMHEAEGLDEPSQKAMVIVRPSSSSVYGSICAGRDVEQGQDAYIVVSLFKC